jgi:hypothetical protein
MKLFHKKTSQLFGIFKIILFHRILIGEEEIRLISLHRQAQLTRTYLQTSRVHQVLLEQRLAIGYLLLQELITMEMLLRFFHEQLQGLYIQIDWKFALVPLVMA